MEKDWSFSVPHWWDFWLHPWEPRCKGSLTQKDKAKMERRTEWGPQVVPPLFPKRMWLTDNRNNAATVCRNTAFFPLSKDPVLITMSFICKMEIKVIIIVYRICSSHRHVPPSEKLHSESWRWVFLCFRSSPRNWPCVSYCWQLDREKKKSFLYFSSVVHTLSNDACQCEFSSFAKSEELKPWRVLCRNSMSGWPVNNPIPFMAIEWERHFISLLSLSISMVSPGKPCGL